MRNVILTLPVNETVPDIAVWYRPTATYLNGQSEYIEGFPDGVYDCLVDDNYVIPEGSTVYWDYNQTTKEVSTDLITHNHQYAGWPLRSESVE